MKINFNKFSVILMYICIIGLPVICSIKNSWPPDMFIICWFAFWMLQAIVTSVLKKNKRKTEQSAKLLDKITPYINENNAEAIIEKCLGVEVKTTKKKETK